VGVAWGCGGAGDRLKKADETGSGEGGGDDEGERGG